MKIFMCKLFIVSIIVQCSSPLLLASVGSFSGQHRDYIDRVKSGTSLDSHRVLSLKSSDILKESQGQLGNSDIYNVTGPFNIIEAVPNNNYEFEKFTNRASKIYDKMRRDKDVTTAYSYTGKALAFGGTIMSFGVAGGLVTAGTSTFVAGVVSVGAALIGGAMDVVATIVDNDNKDIVTREIGSYIKNKFATDPNFSLKQISDMTKEQRIELVRNSTKAFDEKIISKLEGEELKNYQNAVLKKQSNLIKLGIVHGQEVFEQFEEVSKKDRKEYNTKFNDLYGKYKILKKDADVSHQKVIDGLLNLNQSLGDVTKDLAEIEQEFGKVSKDVALLKYHSFKGMSSKDKLELVNKGLSIDDLNIIIDGEQITTEKYKELLKQEVKVQEKKAEKIQVLKNINEYAQYAGLATNIAANLGILSGKQASVISKGFNLATSFAAACLAPSPASILNAASAITSLLGRKKGDPAVERHKQVMKKLNELAEGQKVIRKNQREIFDLQLKTFEMIQNFWNENRNSFKAIDSRIASVLDNQVTISNQISTLLKSVDFNSKAIQKAIAKNYFSSLVAREMLTTIMNRGYSKCYSFLNSRNGDEFYTYDFDGKKFESYESLEEHFYTERNDFSSCLIGLNEKFGVLSSDQFQFDPTLLLINENGSNDIKSSIDDFVDYKYNKMLDFVKYNAGNHGIDSEVLFGNLYYRNFDVFKSLNYDIVNDVQIKDRDFYRKIYGDKGQTYDISLMMEKPLSAVYVEEATKTLFDMLTYYELIDYKNNLIPYSELFRRRRVNTSKQVRYLKTARVLVNASIAQEYLVSGSGIVSLMSKVFEKKQKSSFEERLTSIDRGYKDLEHILATNPVAANNFLKFQIAKEMKELGYSEITYGVAYGSINSDLLKEITVSNWNFKFIEGVEKNKGYWAVIVKEIVPESSPDTGERVIPLPVPSEMIGVGNQAPKYYSNISRLQILSDEIANEFFLYHMKLSENKDYRKIFSNILISSIFQKSTTIQELEFENNSSPLKKDILDVSKIDSLDIVDKYFDEAHKNGISNIIIKLDKDDDGSIWYLGNANIVIYSKKDNQDISRLLKWEAMRSVKTLKFVSIMSNDQVVDIANSELLGNLEFLDLRANNIGDEGVLELAFSSNLSPKKLNLSMNSITADGVAMLSESEIFIEKLQDLDISDNELGVDGIFFLVESSISINLKRLNISKCKVGNDGMNIIYSSENMNGLEFLDISYNGLDDNAIIALANSKNMQNLKELNIAGNDVSVSAIQAIKKSPYMKKLKVFEY